MRRLLCALSLLLASTALQANTFSFTTGAPDGLVGTAARIGSIAGQQIETADDFTLANSVILTSATFTGLLPLGASLSSISQVEIEFYNIFPLDSTNPPSGNVPSRTNSPSDSEIGSATRDSANNSLTYSATLLSSSFTASNTVVNGIFPKPNQTTGGEGAVTGEEVQIMVNFSVPVELGAGHYFFRPEVLLSSGTFLWLSAPKPGAAGDLQTWIRNDALSPDWLRVGTDVIGGPTTFNASFSLAGEVVPEPSSLVLLGTGILGVLGGRRQLRR